jgi:hypothetical protein
MKVLTVFLAIVALLTLTACGDDFDAEAEKAKLEALSEEYYDAYEVQDMAVHRRMEDDEDYQLFFAGSTWSGIATAEDTAPEPGVIGTDITVDSREWKIAPGLAVARSRETWVWPDGNTAHILLTMVWEKKDGEWYLVHSHFSEHNP